jgi:uncharacterized protein (DUF486 family)
MRPIFATVGLLALSNVFMTIAWYFHLKQEGWPLRKAILISFGLLIAAVVAMFQD